MASEPIHHETLDLYARVGDTEHVIGQARVPILMEIKGTKGKLRNRVAFTAGDPIVEAVPGWDQKGLAAKAAIDAWKAAIVEEMTAILTGLNEGLDPAEATPEGDSKTPKDKATDAPVTAPEPAPEPTPATTPEDPAADTTGP